MNKNNRIRISFQDNCLECFLIGPFFFLINYKRLYSFSNKFLYCKTVIIWTAYIWMIVKKQQLEIRQL